MSNLKLIKITLLIIILAEEIRSVKEKDNDISIKSCDIANKQNGLNKYKYI